MINEDQMDFNLCSNICGKITDKYGANTSASNYPEAERTVVLVWTVAGIIENGGFRYLFGSVLPGDPYCVLSIRAFENIGSFKAAEAIKKAVCLFPDCMPPAEDKKRIQWFEEQPEEMRNQLDTAFWDELDNITENLTKFIRNNRLDKTYA